METEIERLEARAEALANADVRLAPSAEEDGEYHVESLLDYIEGAEAAMVVYQDLMRYVSFEGAVL